MKNSWLFIFLLITSCYSKQELNPIFKNKKEWTIKLENNLGTVSLFLPKIFDTSFNWLHISDCGARCNEYKYRIQPKSLRINKETGFFWKDLEDSVLQITIKHLQFKYPNIDTTEFKLDQNAIYNIYNTSFQIHQSVNWIDTFRSLDNRLFICSNYSNSEKDSIVNQYLECWTVNKSNLIEIVFISKTNNNSLDTSFISKAIESIKTVSIKN